MNLFGNLTLPLEKSGVEWLSNFLRDTLPFLDPGLARCEKLIVANHIYFQIANVLFLLSHFAPSGKCGIVYLRFMLLVGCVFFAIWGLEILCSLDILIWNLTFVFCNFIHIFVLLVQMWPTRFTKEIEELYVELFKPLKVSRKQFKKLVKCIKSIRVLKYQEIYAQEKVTRVEFLSVVLSGKLVISQQNRPLHIVYPHQFLDSSEWFSASTDEFFQVSITAVEDSRILLWHRDKLKLSIGHDKFLKDILDHILSRDVVNKMIQVNEFVTASTNGHLPMTYDDDVFCDNKSLMIVKNTGDGSGISALLSKQLQVNYLRSLRLSKIDEVDMETSV